MCRVGEGRAHLSRRAGKTEGVSWESLEGGSCTHRFSFALSFVLVGVVIKKKGTLGARDIWI